ncbi:MAG: FkbM family methyltransferase [Phyllobacteriaceae bacterium]|nr:FkbM family methyltransferase [Phyllobacteriaceae bacterium]
MPTNYNLLKYIVEDKEFYLHFLMENTAFIGFHRAASSPKRQWWEEGYNAAYYPSWDFQHFALEPKAPVALKYDNGLAALGPEHERGFLADAGRIFSYGPYSRYRLKLRDFGGEGVGRIEVAVTLRPAVDPTNTMQAAELDIQLDNGDPVAVKLGSMHPAVIRLEADAPADGVIGLSFRHKGKAAGFPFNVTCASDLLGARNIELFAVSVAPSPIAGGVGEIRRTRGEICEFGYEGQGFSFLVNDRHDSIQAYHYAGEFYEIEELELIRSHVMRGARILDVGANIGNHCVYFSRVMGASSITPIEVQPKVISLLSINLKLNDLSGIDTSRLGVGFGKKEDTANIFIPQAFNVAGAQFRSDSRGEFRIRRGDDVIAGSDFDFIKIDVEGMECDVVEGLSETIGRCKPIMFVEVWNDNLARFHEQLRTLNYEVIAEFRRYDIATNLLVRSIKENG